MNDLAYLAGILDGEGCFGIYRYNRGPDQPYNYRPSVTVASTSPDLLRWLELRFRGEVCHHSEGDENREASAYWTMRSKTDIVKLVPHVIPFLIVKKLQAVITLEFCEKFNIGSGSRYTDEDRAEMDKYYQLSKLANSS